jgi:hypothetical protein
MTQGGLRAGCKHRRHPPGSATDDDVSNGVHPLMQTVKPVRPETSIDRTSRNTEAHQLPARHDTMLPLRKLSQTTINISVRDSIRAFTTHIVVNARLVPGGDGRIRHGTDGAEGLRTEGALIVAKAQRKGGSSPPLPPLALIP